MKIIIVALTLSLFLAGKVAGQQLRIGIVADCQYCDCDYNEQWNNDYRKAPARLQEAVAAFNASEVDLVFHLGDFIDRDFGSYKTVMPIMNELAMPFYFVLGNHDFSVADSLKASVYEVLKLKKSYYTVKKKNWLFIVLDGTEISTYRSADSDEIAKANLKMEAYKNQGREQAKPWNGAISEKQMNWLNQELGIADAKGLNAIVLCHFPVLPEADVNLWNDAEIVKIIEKHRSAKAYFAGHHHPGNYAESSDVHFVTFNGMVMTQNENAFAIVYLWPNRIQIDGFGREPDRDLQIRK